MSDGTETGVLPGMGDLPERVSPAPAGRRTKPDGPKTGGAEPGRPKRASRKGKREPAETLPVARVAVDMSLPHLDRPFDYLVPTTLDTSAVPGCRVRVRFAGQLVDGYLLERVEESEHEGRLAYLERVTSPEPVLAPEIAALAREIADRYAGTLADVLRLAIPPRHARVEAENQNRDARGVPAKGGADPGETPAPVEAGAGEEDRDEPPARSAPQPDGADRPSGAAPPGNMASGEERPLADRTNRAGGAVPAGGVAGGEGRSLADRANRPGGAVLASGEETSPAGGVDRSGGTSSAGGVAGGEDRSPADRANRPGGAVAAGGVALGEATSPAGGVGRSGGTSSAGGVAVGEDRSPAGRTNRPDGAVPEGGVTPGETGSSADRPDRPDRPDDTPSPGDDLVHPTVQAPAPVAVEAGPWLAYTAGPAFLGALAAGRAPRAVWSALPGHDWAPAVARAVAAVLASGRGALVVVADGRDVARVDAALAEELGRSRHVALTAELGPAERYRRWLAVRRGDTRVVVGTRAAMFAPVRDLGLVVLWDDGDDVHAEPHAPYPHAREVLALRAHRGSAGALIGGFTRTTDATQLVAAGWAHPLVPVRERLRAAMAYIRPAGDDAELARDEAARTARLPHIAFRTARQGLESGPVLVQVPRRGYVPALACSRCRGPARCPECEGPLSLGSSHAAPYCRWCGRIAGAWACPECGGRQVRAVVVGARRTAEELGRAFPGVPVRTSGRDGVLAEVGAEPALVVATPGAEPVAKEGYASALLLDGWVLLGRADLRAGEEALRRWMNAAALVRPRGPVIVLADGSLTPVQALIRWDAVTYAERELAERRELGFPPAVRMASLTGSPQSIRELVEAAGLPGEAEVLGPVEVGDDQERALVRVRRERGVALARLLKGAQAARSTRKTTDVVRVRVDPLELI